MPSRVSWLLLLCATGCGGMASRGPLSSVRDAAPIGEASPAGDASAAEVPSIWEGVVPDTKPICGQTTSTCSFVPYRTVPGASECDLRVYINPDDRCWCYCATDEAGCGAHGRCIRRGTNPPECECTPGGSFTGAHCDQCLFGLAGPDCTEGCRLGTVLTEDGCKTHCEVEGVTCPERGYCASTAPARCVCLEGYAEPDCTRCAPGYRPEWVWPHTYPAYVGCVPYCEPCAPSRRCDMALRPPACVCRSAYTEVGGECLWGGATDLTLPRSTETCGEWRFFALPSRPSGQPVVPANLSVGAVDGKLFFHVGDCGAVAAGTMVNLPASETMAGAALRIGFAGTPGEAIVVYLGGSLEEAPLDAAGSGWGIAGRLEPVASGGQTTEICISEGAAGERTGLVLWAVGKSTICGSQNLDFTVSEVALVSSLACTGR